MSVDQTSAHFGQIDETEYKRRVRAWTMYDWANSAFVTTVMAAVLPIYYSSVAGATLPSEAAATALWSMGLSISLFVVALLSPILGTISDVMRGKKRFLAIGLGLGVVATGLMVFISTGDWLLASVLFILARIGMTSANVFYDALLPHVARPEDQDEVSTRGYAVGYVGGGILLAVNIVMINTIPDWFDYAGIRLSLLSVAIWWAVFSLPLFRRIPEPPAAEYDLPPGESVVRVSFRQIRTTFGDIQRYKELFKFLIAFLIYNDGIGTIIGVATIYGAELGLGTTELILALLLVQFVGIPYSLVFGRLPSRDTKYRPQFLGFIILAVVALPIVGVAGRAMLPTSVTGAPAVSFVMSGQYMGEGTYALTSDQHGTHGNWRAEVIPAAAQSGQGFVEFVNRVFGAELTDVTYAMGEGPAARLDFPYNGQGVEIVYRSGPESGTWSVLMDGQPLLDDNGQPVVIQAGAPTVRYNETVTITASQPGQHTVSLVSDGSLLSVASLTVLPPPRQSNLVQILGILVGLNALALGLGWVLGKPLFGKLADSLDTKRSVIVALCVYAIIAVWGFFVDSTIEFWFLAWMVSIVQGGSQALSRSLYARMSPAAKSGEFFGLFGVMEKFSAILGPILFAAAGTIFGSSRPAILSLIVFFFVGIFLLTRVDVSEGQRVANTEDTTLLKQGELAT